MNKSILIVFVLLAFVPELSSQSYAFGIKGGLTIGIQNWSDFQRDPLFKWHGIAFIESAPEDNRFAVFAQAGYHVKGSAIRNRNFFNPLNGNVTRPPAQEFIFNNISLTLGGKQKYDFSARGTKVYYLFGMRLDYTVSTNLDQYSQFNERNPAYAIYPFDEPAFINDFNYGATVGGGFEIPFSELVGILVEFTVNPDFSLQYRQPEIPNVIDPYTGNTRTLRPREVRNLTFEVTVGFRFLNKIVYID